MSRWVRWSMLWRLGGTLVLFIQVVATASPSMFDVSSSPGMLVHTSELLTSDSVSSRFGNSLAIAGDTLVVGSPSSSSGSGLVYVFNRDPQHGWVEQHVIAAPDSESAEFFGAAVALEDDTLIVGAPHTSGLNINTPNAGAVYVFVRDSQQIWLQQAVLRVPDAQAQDFFGRSVALSGDTLVVGVNQSVYRASGYVFVRDFQNTWNQQAVLSGFDVISSPDSYTNVAIENDTIVIGLCSQRSSLKKYSCVFFTCVCPFRSYLL